MLRGIGRLRATVSERAALDLNFLLNETVDSRLTVSGGANGTRVNSAGAIVAATCPRFDYDPVTLASNGLLIEEARTNLLLRSAEFDNASWTKTASTATADQTTAPDGTLVADKLSETNTTAVHFAYQAATISAGATYTVSLFAKQAENRYLQIGLDDGAADGGYATYDLQAGTVTQSANKGTGSGVVASIQAFANGWYRLVFTTVVDASATSGRTFIVLSNSATPGFAPSYLGTTGNGVYLWGAQLEAGSLVTSDIPTVASVTRTADSATLTGAGFSAVWNATQNSVVVEFSLKSVSGTRPIASFDDDSTNQQIRLYSSGTDLKLTVTNGGATQADLTLGTVAANTTYKAAFAISANDFAAVLNGGTVQTDTSGTVPAVDRLRLGSDKAGNFGCVWIRRHSTYPSRLPNAQLQALTA
jgi:hypothetical protein